MKLLRSWSEIEYGGAKVSKDIVWITMRYDNIQYLGEIFEEHGYDIYVQYSPIEKFFQIAQECVLSGTKVLIVRGGTGTILKEKVSVPVVDLKTTYIDYYATLEKAFQLTERVALVGWYQHVKNFNKILEYSGSRLYYVELEPYSKIRDQDYIKDILLNIRSSGISVVVGGGAVVEQAQKIGMTGLYVGMEKDYILEAADEARHLLKVVNEQLSRQEIITSIFNCISDGIVALDMRGFITNSNKAARKLLSIDDQVCKYNRFSELVGFPELQRVIQDGIRLTNQIIHRKGDVNTTLVLTVEPILMEEKRVGAVCTIQHADLIKSANKKIRASNIERGLYAKNNFDNIIGNSLAIQNLKKRAARYAETDATVLITGESGTGKELFAQSIHNESSRRNEPFVALNCAAIPENLLESELFGYVKGSFTGARAEGKEGVFERANHGTLFLDEVGEISRNVQTKLLRVIQEREIMRIGDDRIIPIDVRILAASNANLEDAVRRGEFRKDLYYRLCVLPLHIIPLRERGEDSFEIIEYLLRTRYERSFVFQPEAKKVLTEYQWPGNVREISNFVDRMNAIVEHEVITPQIVMGMLELFTPSPQMRAETLNLFEAGENYQKSLRSSRDLTVKDVADALERNHHSRKLAAQELGISTTTLWRKMNKFRGEKEDL